MGTFVYNQTFFPCLSCAVSECCSEQAGTDNEVIEMGHVALISLNFFRIFMNKLSEECFGGKRNAFEKIIDFCFQVDVIPSVYKCSTDGSVNESTIDFWEITFELHEMCWICF